MAMKKIDYEYKPVSLINKGKVTNFDQYNLINPLVQVPSLVIKKDGVEHILTQSMAIIDFLEHLKPTPAIFPSDSIDRAYAISIAEIINSSIQPFQNQAFLHAFQAPDIDMIEWAKNLISKRFIELEEILKKTSGKCCVKDTPCIADVFLIPQVYNAKRFGVDMTKFQIISKINDYLEKCEDFASTAPENQPDAIS